MPSGHLKISGIVDAQNQASSLLNKGLGFVQYAKVKNVMGFFFTSCKNPASPLWSYLAAAMPLEKGMSLSGGRVILGFYRSHVPRVIPASLWQT